MGNKKLYDDKGQLTDEGMATMGLYTVRVGRRVMANKTLLDEYIDKVSKFQLKM